MILNEIVKRRSIRKYKDRIIDEDILKRIMKAGSLAPTAHNRQDWKIIIVDKKELINELVDKASPHQQFLKQASVLLIACSTNADYIMRCGHPGFLIDLAIVLDHISLQAVKEGLGTCWIASFYKDKVKQVLNIPNNIEVVQIMSLGFPDESPLPRPRKSISELFVFNKWQ